MRYTLLTVFLAAALIVPARAQLNEPHRSISTQTVEELTKAAGHLEEAVRQHPDDVELYIYLGMTYTRLDKADAAQQAFETVVRLDPKRGIAHYMLGLIYEKKGLKDKATAEWRACLETAVEPRMRETARKHLHHLASQ